MIDVSLRPAVVYMRDGVWLVPPDQRPKGWEAFGFSERSVVCEPPRSEPPRSEPQSDDFLNPTQEEVASACGEIADQKEEKPQLPKYGGPHYQREYARYWQSQYLSFREFETALQNSGEVVGADKKLISFGRLVIAGMFTVAIGRLARWSGLSEQDVREGAERLRLAGIWQQDEKSKQYMVHMGDQEESCVDLGFWLNAMVAQGTITGAIQDDGTVLYRGSEVTP